MTKKVKVIQVNLPVVICDLQVWMIHPALVKGVPVRRTLSPVQVNTVQDCARGVQQGGAVYLTLLQVKF